MLDAFKSLLRALGLAGPEGQGSEGGAADEGAGNGRSPAGAEGGPPSVEMLSCQEVLERLFEYLDGELESPTEIQVEAHLEKCRRCYPRLQFEKAFMEALDRARAGEEPPTDLRNRVVDALSREGLEIH
ncbi:MAG: zf-HC2 domain-containing protein [Longimicrobiales bacterium]|nr:zf-HC2 domain-containing protein [Longimicrobiales bacterium]